MIDDRRDEGEMLGGMLRHLSLARSQSPLQPERAEPRLVPVNTVSPLRRPLDPVGGGIAASRDSAARPLAAPVDPLADRRPVSSAAQDTGVLRQIIVGSLAVVVVGGLGGAALTWLWPRSNDTLPVASPTVAAPQPTPDAAAPTAIAPPSSPGPTSAATPAAALVRQAPPAEASGAAPSGLPATPASPARAPETTAPTTPSGSPVADAKALPSPATSSAEKPVAPAHPAVAASDAGSPHAAAPQDFTAGREAHAAEPRRPAHVHTALRHLRLRAANEKSGAEPPVDSAHPPRKRPERRVSPAASTGSARRPSGGAEAETSPQPASEQAGSFDELLTHLTGRAKTPDHPADRTSGEALTPPAPGAPDPFAPRLPDQ